MLSKVLEVVTLSRELLEFVLKLLEAHSLALARLACRERVAGTLHRYRVAWVLDNDRGQRLIPTASVDSTD